VEKRIDSKVANEERVRERHNQIVNASIELFSKKGYHKTTMRDISNASRINLSYLYQYINSKDDVLFLFYKRLHEQWEHIYHSLKDSEEQDPVKLLKKTITSLFDIVHELRVEIRTMYTESRHLERDSLRSVLAKESEETRMIEELIIRGTENGLLKTKDAFLAANIIHFLLVLEPLRGWNFSDKYSQDEYREVMVNFIMKMLRVDE
jgi:AcrR family transcriptional regulator